MDLLMGIVCAGSAMPWLCQIVWEKCKNPMPYILCFFFEYKRCDASKLHAKKRHTLCTKFQNLTNLGSAKILVYPPIETHFSTSKYMSKCGNGWILPVCNLMCSAVGNCNFRSSNTVVSGSFVTQTVRTCCCPFPEFDGGEMGASVDGLLCADCPGSMHLKRRAVKSFRKTNRWIKHTVHKTRIFCPLQGLHHWPSKPTSSRHWQWHNGPIKLCPFLPGLLPDTSTRVCAFSEVYIGD